MTKEQKAENLRVWLASSGMSQSEFARQINAPLRTVQNWCGGQREMSNFVYFLIRYRIIEALKDGLNQESVMYKMVESDVDFI